MGPKSDIIDSKIADHKVLQNQQVIFLLCRDKLLNLNALAQTNTYITSLIGKQEFFFFGNIR